MSGVKRGSTPGVIVLCSASRLPRAIHMGAVQGSITHAVHRIRSLSPAEYYRRLADHCQHAVRSDVLRALRWSLNYRDTVVRHVETSLQREGQPLHRSVQFAMIDWLRFDRATRSLTVQYGLTNFEQLYRKKQHRRIASSICCINTPMN